MTGKNPFVSAWLSGANMWAGAARSFWTAEMRRQQNAMMDEASKQIVRFWTGAWATPETPKTRKRRGGRG